MNKLIKAQLAVEEARRAMGTLLDQPDDKRSDDWNTQVETAKSTIETRQVELSAVATMEPEVPEHRQDSPEGLELRKMLFDSNMGRIFEATVAGSRVDGMEAELQQHYKIPANAIPLAMLEKRAAATFSGDEEGNAAAVIPQVFPEGAAAFAGVSVETVPSGQRQYPVLSTGATVNTPAQGADSDETTAAFTITTLTPKRIQAGFSYQIEDAAVFSFMDAALRQNLSDALSDALDKQILNRTSDGLLDKGTDPDTPTAASTAAEYLAAVYGGVDGIYASEAGGVRMLVGPTNYTHMGSLIIGTRGDTNVAQKVAQVSGGIRVNGNVPAYASNFQDALVVKGVARRNCVASVWDGVQLIPDAITRATQGEVKITAVMLYDFSVLRTAGYNRHRFRNS